MKSVIDLRFKMISFMFRFLPGHPSDARRTSWSTPRREAGAE